MINPIERVIFDPANVEHRKAFYHFLEYGQWKMFFKLEAPWLELPAMLSYILHMYNHDKEFANG